MCKEDDEDLCTVQIYFLKTDDKYMYYLGMSDLLYVFIVEMESVVGEVSTQLLELARRQRMNTDVRKNIFCVIMSSQVCVWEYTYMQCIL